MSAAQDGAGRSPAPAQAREQNAGTESAAVAIIPPNPIVAFADQGFLAMVERMAAHPDAVERIVKLAREAQEEDRMRLARDAWHAAMNRVQKKLQPLLRTETNDQTRSRYVDLDNAAVEVSRVATEEGFDLGYREVASDRGEGWVCMLIEVTHTDPLYGAYTVTKPRHFPVDLKGIAGNVNKTPIWAIASASTYAKRYLLFDAFNLSALTAQMDGQRDDDGQAVSQHQRGQMQAAREQAKREREAKKQTRADAGTRPQPWIGRVKAALAKAADQAERLRLFKTATERAPAPADLALLEQVPLYRDALPPDRTEMAVWLAAARRRLGAEQNPTDSGTPDSQTENKAGNAPLRPEQQLGHDLYHALREAATLQEIKALVSPVDTREKMALLKTTDRALFDQVEAEIRDAYARLRAGA